MNQTPDAQSAPTGSADRNLCDRWICSRLKQTIVDTRTHLASYRLDLAAKTLYEFTWNEYCDWYLELSKTVLQDPNAADSSKAATREALVEVLDALLRCLHPLIPFITEEIWQKLAPRDGATIMLQAYPSADAFDRDADAEQQIEWIKGVIIGIRQIRGEMDIAPGRPLTVLLQGASDTDQELLARHELYLKNLGRLSDIRVLADKEFPPPSATALLGAMKILVPMAGVIDVTAEKQRLEKKRGRATDDFQKIQRKLENEQFLTKAPEAVLTKERQRFTELEREISQIDAQLAKLDELI